MDDDVRKKFTRIELFAQAQEYLKLNQYEQKLYNPNYYYQSADYFRNLLNNIAWYVDEIFIPIYGFNNYLISNYGRIYSIKYKQLIKPYIDTYGYLLINMRDNDSKYKVKKVHRLIMLNFNYFPGCEQYKVNHIDGNKTNNYFNPLSPRNNLEWCTQKQNIIHAIKLNLRTYSSMMGSNNPHSVFTEDQINSICKILNSYPNCSVNFVLNKLDFKISYDHLRHLIYKIKEKIQWQAISDNYPNIPRSAKKHHMHDEAFYHEFCKLLKRKASAKEIANILNISITEVYTIRQGILKLHFHSDIASQYNLW